MVGVPHRPLLPSLPTGLARQDGVSARGQRQAVGGVGLCGARPVHLIITKI
jgi:hypothetical protein